MSSPFLLGSLNDGYRWLDSCPAAILAKLLAATTGTPRQRAEATDRWRSAFLAGQLPEPTPWPEKAVQRELLRVLGDLDIVRFCAGQVELTDALMLDVVDAFLAGTLKFAQDTDGLFRDLVRSERDRRAIAIARRFGAESGSRIESQDLSDDERELLRRRARASAAAGMRGIAADIDSCWRERSLIWGQVAAVFGDLGLLLGGGWDLGRGILRHVGWLEMARLQRLLDALPELEAILRSLGRLQQTHDGESVAETVFEPMQRLAEARRERRVPYVPAEMRGITRSADIARMLPVEAAQLGHPKLRYLWHARRAEQALLSYRVEGVATEIEYVEFEETARHTRNLPRPERGPIIAVIDTSGSMSGAREAVAKALVLQALRVAHGERRRCLVMQFSGPGDIEETELSVSKDGLGQLFAFLSTSFGGGTYIDGAVAHVLTRLGEGDWRKADVLIVSDGDFRASDSITRDVHVQREEGTRFHGVLVGGGVGSELSRVCDPIHRFTAWASLAGAARSVRAP